MAASVQRLPLPVDIIESEEIVQYISPAVLKMDYGDTKIMALWIVGTFTLCAISLTSMILLCNLFPAFRNIGLKYKIFLALSVVRGMFGIFSTAIGMYAVFWTTNLERDVVFGTTATSSIGMLVTVGFFIFELAAVVASDIAFGTFSKLLIIHHTLGVVSYSPCVYHRINFSLGCKALLLEMSTPFSCLSYVLLKAGMENSAIWRINQMILVHTFHLRSVVECYMWYFTYTHWPYIWDYLPTGVFILTYTGLVLVTFLMTPYWGYKKTQQLFNPVDWNFQESKVQLSNENSQSTNGVAKKLN